MSELCLIDVTGICYAESRISKYTTHQKLTALINEWA